MIIDRKTGMVELEEDRIERERREIEAYEASHADEEVEELPFE